MSIDVVLVRDSKPQWKDKRQTTGLRRKHEIELPAWWSAAVPTYLGRGGRMEPDLRKQIIRLLGIATEYYTIITLPQLPADQRRDSSFSTMITYMMASYAWKDGVAFLSQEIDYFWEQAITGPSVEDFAHLKRSRKYAEKLYRDLKTWLAEVEPLLQPSSYRNEALLVNELKDLLIQIYDLRRETTDTFQLLMGAIAIQDSEVQKNLARESRIQVRRSTALTALAAIYLPLSLTTSVFGMNISELEQGRPKYWVVLALGFGLFVATLPFLLWIFIDRDNGDGRQKRRPASDQPRNDSGSSSSNTANGAIRELDDSRTKQRAGGIAHRNATMSSRIGRVAAGELRPNTPARLGDMV
jgi:hypothetical protein